MSGWIKLHRGLIDWEWYTDHNTCRLFIHCILRANHTDTKWRGHKLSRGEFLTSLESLSNETGLTISQIRTGFKKLESTNEIASLSQARSRIVTVLKYDSYQADDKLNDRLIAGKSQANRSEIATDKNVRMKECKNTTIVIPDGINVNAWNEWLDYRRAKKKTVSPKAAKKQFELLSDYALDVQQQIINQSIQNDYQGLFAPKGNNNGISQQSNQPKQSLIEISAEQTRRIWAECEAEEARISNVAKDESVIQA